MRVCVCMCISYISLAASQLESIVGQLSIYLCVSRGTFEKAAHMDCQPDYSHCQVGDKLEENIPP